MDAVKLSKLTTLWTPFCSKLLNRYTIIDAYNLLSYDHSFNTLYSKLVQYKSKNFATNERLIFTLYDTDFYFLDSKIGFTTYNLINLLLELDISLGYCILLTNHHGLSNHVKKLCLEYNQPFPIVVDENNFCRRTNQFKHSVDTLPKFNVLDMQYHFCCLNHTHRSHRIFMRCYLESRPDIKNKTLFSWHVPDTTQKVEPDETLTDSRPATSHNYRMSTIPFTRINDKIETSKSRLPTLFNDYSFCTHDHYQNPLITSDPGTRNDSYDFFKYTFINLVTETVFNFPYPYLTEKTFCNIWKLRPFIIIGAPHSINYLKNLGFKTFDQWWSEDYDQISNHEERLLAIFDLIDIISNWSLDRCQEVYNDMQDVLEYNYRHYVNYFCKDLLEQNQLLV